MPCTADVLICKALRRWSKQYYCCAVIRWITTIAITPPIYMTAKCLNELIVGIFMSLKKKTDSTTAVFYFVHFSIKPKKSLSSSPLESVSPAPTALCSLLKTLLSLVLFTRAHDSLVSPPNRLHK